MATLLTYSEVAAQLRVTEAFIRTAARNGTIPRRQFGRTYRFTQDDVDQFIENAHRAGRDPYARTARQVAAMNRTRKAA